MARRSQRQIELDCKRIQEIAKTATSMKEIERITGLSQSEIKTSLSKHPRIAKKVQTQVEENKIAAELAAKAQKTQSEQSADESQSAIEKVNIEDNNEPDFEKGVVIDTSMIEVDVYYDMLCNICATEAKIVLTSVVRQELNKMQFVKKDYKASRARSIMAMAAERPEKFVNVLIDETLATHDDCIVKYCVDNKDRVVLFTADKNMALDAREQAVKVEYFRHDAKEVKTLKTVQEDVDKSDVRTLNPARRVGNKLLIMEMQGTKRDIRVWSDGQEYVDGIVELKIGDDVLIVAKKKDCITFAHYRMITLYEEYNCKLVYSCRIYEYAKIEELPKGSYKTLAREFWNKHGLKK